VRKYSKLSSTERPGDRGTRTAESVTAGEDIYSWPNAATVSPQHSTVMRVSPTREPKLRGKDQGLTIITHAQEKGVRNSEKKSEQPVEGPWHA
jgi:hypothetical protein